MSTQARTPSLAERVFASQFHPTDSPREHLDQCLRRSFALAETLRFSASIAGFTDFDRLDPDTLEELANVLKTEVSTARAFLEGFGLNPHGEQAGSE